MNEKDNLDRIIDFVLSDDTVDYGYYGSKALLPKRFLWWKRLEIARDIYEKYEKGIGKNSLLDFGCQFGFFSVFLSKEFKNVYLIETAQEYLDLGVYMHSKLGNGNYKAIINSKDNPSEFIGKISEKVDLFLFFDVLEHVRDVNQMLLNLRRISKSNTYLIISLPTENLIYLLLTMFRKEKGHINRYFVVEKALRESGYKLVEKRSLFMLFNIYLYRCGEN
ncbi:class I SAM-dependent methyltransferase [candidate division WWE3 bacterium]|uniref:Class I SAM-dependent methyltransferase n=1 Tax=candidate division WWE3 bacterium TaxID=2053526 RepID=A0A7X9HSH1_UNCKA|nr:class I SAM-dependent methyltransferase [candidate division WWE3 bacterium]